MSLKSFSSYSPFAEQPATPTAAPYRRLVVMADRHTGGTSTVGWSAGPQAVDDLLTGSQDEIMSNTNPAHSAR